MFSSVLSFRLFVFLSFRLLVFSSFRLTSIVKGSSFVFCVVFCLSPACLLSSAIFGVFFLSIVFVCLVSNL